MSVREVIGARHLDHRLKLIDRSLALAGILCVTAACSGQADSPPTVGPEVGVVTLQPQDVMLTTEVPGNTSVFLIAEIRPHVGGIILQPQFEEGTNVEAGQVLYQIDPTNYQAAFNRARATLSRAEANQLAARLRAERSGNPVGKMAISQDDDADADVAYKHAQAAVLAAHAALDAARINLAHTRVTAPIAGLIAHSTVTSGALVTASQPTPLTTVLLLDPIYVDLTQSSAAVQRMKQELASGKQHAGAAREQVWLRLGDGSKYAYAGKLEVWEEAVDEGPSSVSLRAVFPNPEGELMPGMSVRAQLQEGVRSQALLVPQRAVTHDTIGQATVFVVDTHNRVEAQLVTTERRVGDQWLISAGLKAGERVVVDGVQRVRPGITVTPASSRANTPEEDQRSDSLVAAN